MSSKRSKSFKAPRGALKEKPNKSDPEIFVLPPNILQKLGINLENVGNVNKEPNDEKSGSDIHISYNIPNHKLVEGAEISPDQNTKSKKCNANNSILETANLMKESVFLSPTFACTIDSNVKSLELETSSVIETKIIEINGTKILPISTKINLECNEGENGPRVLKNVSSETLQVHQNESNDFIPLPQLTVRNELTDILKIPTQVTPTDDHPDEAYSSDCSNSNLGCTESRNVINCFPELPIISNQPPKESKAKINILSDEILNLTQLKELKHLHFAYIPDSINSVTNEYAIFNKLNTEDSSTFPLGVGDVSDKIFDNVSKNKPYKNINTTKLFEKKSDQNSVNGFILNHEINKNSALSQDPANVKEQQRQLNENNFGDCIDLAVSDIEKHLKENEDTLESFVKELTSNDDNAILDKIEKTEKEGLTPMVLNEIEEDLHRVTNILSEVMYSKESNDTSTNESIVSENANISFNSKNSLKKSNAEEYAKDVQLNNSSSTNKTYSTNVPVSNNIKKYSIPGINSNTSNVLATNEKIKEIAIYLKQFVKNRPKKEIDDGKQQKQVTLPKKTSKHTDTKPKLYAHGVEKPGGSKKGDDSFTTLKMYGKSKKKHESTSMNIDKKYLGVQSNMEDLSIDQNVVMEHDLLIPQFCLCEDFGRMAYYDSEYLYEHIHFWDHKSIDCNEEILFSIYSDDSSTEILNKHECTFEFVQDNIKEESQTPVSNICWNMHMTNDDVNDVIETDQCTVMESKILTEPFANIVRNSIFSVDKNKDLIQVESIEIHKSEVTNLNVREEWDSSKNTIILESAESSLSHEMTAKKENLKSNESTVSMEILDEDVEEQSQKPRNRKLSCVEVSFEMRLVKDNSQSGKETSMEIDEPDISITEVSNSENQKEEVIEKTNISSKNTSVDSTTKFNNMEETTRSLKNKDTRKRSKSHIEDTKDDNSEPAVKKLTKCGVCKEVLDKSKWDEHISNEHNFIAWKEGESIDLKDQELFEKLQRKKEVETFIHCHMCTKTYKSVKRFLSHVDRCLKSINHVDATSNITVQNTSNEILEIEAKEELAGETGELNAAATAGEHITCGVCKEIIGSADWMNHISQKHSYLAWKSNEDPLDLDDDEKIKQHLTTIVRKIGNLTCSICDTVYKQARFFLGHIRKCKEDEDTSTNSTAIEENNDEDSTAVSGAVVNNKSVCCGVCGANIGKLEWYDHMGQEHGYLAWIDGEDKLDVNDEEQVKQHLYAISKMYGGLICSKCGLNRKYVKSFMQHVQKCTGDVANDSINKTDTSFSDHIVNSDVVKCGICHKRVDSDDWIQHIKILHCYMAWKDGQCLDLSNEKEVQNHLETIIMQTGKLYCMKCKTDFETAESFIRHAEKCRSKLTFVCAVCSEDIDAEHWDHHKVEVHSNLAWIVGEKPINISTKSTAKEDNKVDRTAVSSGVIDNQSVRCGVCAANIVKSAWYDHMGQEHGYLAWIDGEDKLDVNDEELVKQHLYAISKMYGGLICSKCGLNRKYVKSFMQHVQNCTGEVVNESIHKKETENILNSDIVKCGVCYKFMNSNDWMQHIKIFHNYMAWKVGESLDLSDKKEVENHLEKILKQTERLHCIKCKIDYETVDSYMQHAKQCRSKFMFVCAVCSEAIEPEHWDRHKMKVHYNVAWIVGEKPIDLKSPTAVERLIKEYKNRYKLVCKNCGISRVSCMGFYAHIIVCGKTEEEADFHKKLCDICNKKYLCVYENQHMTYHKEQKYILERKQKEMEDSAAREEERKNKKVEEDTEEVSSGRRRAAQKARNVIEKYQNDINNRQEKCSCDGANVDCCCSKKDFSDSDESVVLEGSENETDDSDVDSDVSNEEEEVITKRNREHIPASALKVRRFPFVPRDIDSYLDTSAEEFCNFYYKNKNVYPDWYTKEWEPVPQESLSEYMPPLEESCRFKVNESWDTLKRFEAKEHIQPKAGNVPSLFVGCCIQAMAWAPAMKKHTYGHYLAVIGDLSADFPKLEAEDNKPCAGLIQIWNFGQFDRLPKFAIGLAHNYGIAWSMDWCPAGARDSLPADESLCARLGLLAVAFSTGAAYIFSIPYPHLIVKDENLIYKLKPLVELRLTMKSDRTLPQATAINWSLQGNCDTVVVAYSDGTMATFDLNTESPFLKSTENGVTILHPYYDKKVLNSCVTGVSTYPSMAVSQQTAALCASSLTGSALVARLAARPSSQHMFIASADARFQPLWPSAIVATDDGGSATATSNELEWWGVGRRLGPAQAAHGCERCARAAIAAPPLLAVIRRHPVNDYASKRLVALVDMTRLTKKRKIINDDLQVMLEPFTYEDAVKKYGLEIVLDKVVLNQTTLSRTLYPDRFPLADVTCVRFCPSPTHHNKLAVATHAGIIVLIHV